MDTTPVAIAQRADLIPFVYNYCDQWCGRCPAKLRCLSYVSWASGSPLDVAAANALAERTRSPVARLDADLCDPDRTPREPIVGDPLERQARRYLVTANHFLATSGLRVGADRDDTTRSPEAVVAGLHLLIGIKVYRALVSLDRASRGIDLLDDAMGCARLVLVAIAESLQAFEQLAKRDDDPRVSDLMTQLVALGEAVRQRFPGAEAFVRLGLDQGCRAGLQTRPSGRN
jgi:hypothetical protein